MISLPRQPRAAVEAEAEVEGVVLRILVLLTEDVVVRVLLVMSLVCPLPPLLLGLPVIPSLLTLPLIPVSPSLLTFLPLPINPTLGAEGYGGPPLGRPLRTLSFASTALPSTP